jgi:threonine/homoserine/homoserine lactone efflux protein
MVDSAQLAGFVVVAAVLVMTPGPNTLLILTNSVTGGRAAGMATVLGIETGTLIHTIAAAVGISAILASSMAAFDAVKYGGAAYLAVAGWRLWRNSGTASPDVHERPLTPAQTFRRALVVSVLNPKAAIFFLAFLPQFVRREHGGVAGQFVILGLIVAVIGFTVGCVLTMMASRAQTWLRHEPAVRWRERLTGGVLIGLGLRLAFAQQS